MRKTIYTMAVNGFSPEITAMTFPLMRRYADWIGADFHVIEERAFPGWPITYEKLQVHRLMAERDDDWSLFFDADAVIHPEMPDLTELLPRDAIAHNGTDMAAIRWRYDDYFRRDGRNIGSCTWLVVCPRWCRDLWRPLDDLTRDEALSRIRVTEGERRAGMEAEHLIDDYTLSRNIARYGLKVEELRHVWDRLGLSDSAFLWHIYATPEAEKIAQIRELLTQWKLA